MLILGIETSCDETSAAVIAVDGTLTVRSNIVASQIDIHAKTGGVVPEVAAREHVTVIIPTINEALQKADVQPHELDLIAVTKGPGLIPALLVGLETASALAWAWKKPIVGVNHLAGHVYANWLGAVCHPGASSRGDRIQSHAKLDSIASLQNDRIAFPALALIVSGGHTELVLMREPEHFELIGATVDDAAGEAFDKIAKLLGLPYPGGPAIAKLAEQGDATAFDFPRPMLNSKDFNFSFSGLKTAVLYTVRDMKKIPAADLAASAQQAIADVLVTKTLRAAKKHKPKMILLAGGVAANQLLRETLAAQSPIAVHCPPIQYCMDNGAMIAAAGYFAFQKNGAASIALDADPHLAL